MHDESEMEGPVGDLAASGSALSPPGEPEPVPPSKPDDRMDALLLKLQRVDQRWGETFAASPEINPKAYARLQKLMNRYGKTTVRKMLEFALEQEIHPQGESAMPVAVALCKVVTR